MGHSNPSSGGALLHGVADVPNSLPPRRDGCSRPSNNLIPLADGAQRLTRFGDMEI